MLDDPFTGYRYDLMRLHFGFVVRSESGGHRLRSTSRRKCPAASSLTEMVGVSYLPVLAAQYSGENQCI